jgi:hypothetical protein
MLFGYDVGQAMDYSAFGVMNKTMVGKQKEYQVPHLERFPLNMSYPAQISKIKNRIQTLGVEDDHTIVVDATGVGKPVLDIMEVNGLNVIGVVITGGQKYRYDLDTGCYNVPKRDIISTLQVLFQNKQIKFASGMEFTDILIKELINFKVKITKARNETYEAWREGDHDDLVLMLGVVAWYAVEFGETNNVKRKPVQQHPLVTIQGL